MSQISYTVLVSAFCLVCLSQKQPYVLMNHIDLVFSHIPLGESSIDIIRRNIEISVHLQKHLNKTDI